MKILLIFALAMAACAGPTFEARDEEQSPATPETVQPGERCYLQDPEQAPDDGACWTITADTWSALAACGNTTPANEVRADWGSLGHPLHAFDVAPGDCFEWYVCDEGATAPKVTPCQ